MTKTTKKPPNKKTATMEIEQVEISQLIPAPYNPRKDLKPGDSEYNKINNSVEHFGLVDPIIIKYPEMDIIQGHQRIKPLIAQGKTKLNMVRLGDIAWVFDDTEIKLRGDADIKALNIALNKISGEWDDRILSDLLSELQEIPDFDIDLTGFDLDEIATLEHDLKVHDARYKPGVKSITGSVDFIKDEIQAMSTDEECQEIFKDIKTILIAFSGGKDSTFALLWAKTNFPDKQIIATFADTGVEFPGFVAHIQECCEYAEVEWKIIKPEKDMWIEILKHGWPSIIHRSCQHEFIYKHINKYFKEYNASEIVIIDGSRADQVNRTTRKTKTSPPADKTMHKYKFYHPTFDIDKELQEQILIKSGIPIWEGYDMGFQRTACWMCPGQNGDQALALSENYPGLVDVIRRWEIKIGKPLQASNDRSIDNLIESGKVNRKRRDKKAKE